MTIKHHNPVTRSEMGNRRFQKRTVNRQIRRAPMPLTLDDEMPIDVGLKTTRVTTSLVIDGNRRRPEWW